MCYLIYHGIACLPWALVPDCSGRRTYKQAAPGSRYRATVLCENRTMLFLTRKTRTGLCAALALAAVCFAPLASPADTIRIPVAAMGYASDATLESGTPLGFYIPVYAQFAGARAHFALRLSGSARSAARIVITVNGRIVKSVAASRLPRSRVLDVPLPRAGGAPGLESDSHCKSSQQCASAAVRGVLVAAHSWIGVRTQPRRGPRSPFDVMHDYRGVLTFVVPRAPTFDQLAAVLRSAYFLHQQGRWRHWHFRLARQPARNGPTIVVGAFRNDLRIRRDVVYADAHGLDRLSERASDLFSASQVLPRSADVPLPTQRSFDDLGIGTLAQPAGRASFDVPFTVAESAACRATCVSDCRSITQHFRRANAPVYLLPSTALPSTILVSPGRPASKHSTCR